MNQSSFGRKRDQRNLMLRNLATSVILYESVTTTDAKGRAVQPIVDRLIRTGQSEDKLTARRKLMAYLTDEKAVNKILEELVTRFNDRQSGFTRRYQLPPRLGDGAPRVIVQLSKTVLLESAPTKAASAKESVTEGESNE